MGPEKRGLMILATMLVAGIAAGLAAPTETAAPAFVMVELDIEGAAPERARDRHPVRQLARCSGPAAIV
jgi:hypothetical protein